ncbi:MAG: YegS/Rv2252/BmrU family lipid kinase [Oscillospiraceae bacterium]|jgi:YegS/Rv2252/BmrU family lipid kinase|nr:YegS/Rv2252/BmrU family lipid kinase [Oscillospiraceae bacterium]
MNDFSGKRAIVIINPVSGKRTTKSQLYDITALFSAQGLETTVYTTTCAGDACRMARERGADFDIMVVRGGDGTLNEVVNGLMQLEKRPVLGYIPSGSTNDLARTLGIPPDTQEALQIVMSGQPLWLDLGLFNGQSYYTYTASFGAFVEISYATPQKLKNLFGRNAYFLGAGKSLKNVHRIPGKVTTAEGFEFEGDFAFASVTNSTSVAGLIKLPRADVDLGDGMFELIIAAYPDKFSKLLRNGVGMVMKDFSREGVYYVKTRRAAFEFGESVPWTLDGEFGGAHTHAVVENVHNAVELFRR